MKSAGSLPHISTGIGLGPEQVASLNGLSSFPCFLPLSLRAVLCYVLIQGNFSCFLCDDDSFVLQAPWESLNIAEGYFCRDFKKLVSSARFLSSFVVPGCVGLQLRPSLIGSNCCKDLEPAEANSTCDTHFDSCPLPSTHAHTQRQLAHPAARGCADCHTHIESNTLLYNTSTFPGLRILTHTHTNTRHSLCVLPRTLRNGPHTLTSFPSP